MGYLSELGPIDPQLQVAVSGVIHWVSALAFVELRDKLMKEIAEATAKKEPTTGLLQQLAGLNIPFTQEMENQLNFAEKTAARLLDKFMLAPKIKPAGKRAAKAKQIARKLLSKQLFPVHGHFISATSAKNDLDLDIDELDMNDDLWKLIWQYYIRCDVQMNMPVPNAPQHVRVKLFKSSAQSLITPDTAN